MIRVGINGFGRIGRSVFRILSDRQDIAVVAINDLAPVVMPSPPPASWDGVDGDVTPLELQPLARAASETMKAAAKGRSSSARMRTSLRRAQWSAPHFSRHHRKRGGVAIETGALCATLGA